jgi:hypothetical protein
LTFSGRARKTGSVKFAARGAKFEPGAAGFQGRIKQRRKRDG